MTDSRSGSNVTVILLAAVLVLVLLGSVLGVGYFWRQAELQRQEAEMALREAVMQRERAEQAQVEADRARAEAARQRDAAEAIARHRQAEDNFQQARAAVDAYLAQAAKGEPPAAEDRMRKEVLQAALKYYEDVLQEKANDPEAKRGAEAIKSLLKDFDEKGKKDK